ncbi:Kif3C type kinesin-like protein [Volvox carteri f. nagariensis]|uniref:Kinesin-like protein n=1 Tax=Volvox carteri f. nagariensis TaxID=3068 RepID=D8U7P5_VOLCA|nr:Kif3C type kinesin-like protein [Volvox carteri f. nagariensis]EFJ44338.1 Kif3C type kinesin-like protein [Volvox carteri f. nagariensis]|eukprot:XP_002954697.1 Kif3C type kinesin-like protein [Volvox carteri f. nagariensis]
MLRLQVLELKGNIRVLCRVRPLLEKERTAGGEGHMPVKVTSEEALRVAAMDNKAEKDFEFDRVLAPDEGQDKLYDEVSALITSVLDGFNVAIMAYGQTGSGKTFTMEGPEGNPGVNLRALADLFKLAEERSAQFTTSFTASVLEIYNEQIYDLLVSGAQDGDKLDVKQGPDGMYVSGLKVEDVHNMGDVTSMIGRGKSNRSTFATNMNEHSSRSHLVLSVYVTCVSKMNGSTLRGKLHLIDLAGSERLSRTGAQGDRLKEAQAINKSLSALGDVIQALQQRNAHIPYRNSKLTRLLEDSLGGNSKCVMIVNVSPAVENVSETKCSLEFASRARKVELGRARANVTSGDFTSALSSSASANGGSASVTPSPAPSRPMSGRGTPAGESSMSRVASRETMNSQMRRSSGPTGILR